VLLAAGLGTRLRADGDETPKCLRPVGSAPFIVHTLRSMAAHGVRQVVVNLHYRAEQVRRAIGQVDLGGLEVRFQFEPELLGTAGSVRAASAGLTVPLLVWYADNYSAIDPAALLRTHRASGADATIAVHRREDASASGVVEHDEDGQIMHFREKPGGPPRPGLVNAGIYIVDSEVMALIPGDGPSDFGRDVFPDAVARGRRLQAHPLGAGEELSWIDTPADLARTRAAFAGAAGAAGAAG
jgi:NDP-sugar pyrophosphorylase family protein